MTGHRDPGPSRPKRGTRDHAIDVAEPLTDLDAETLAHSIATQLAEHPNGPEAADTLDRLATLTAARSAADAHLARIIRRALTIHRRNSVTPPANTRSHDNRPIRPRSTRRTRSR